MKSAKDLLLNRLGYSEPSAQRPMWRLSEGEGDMGLATVAEEVPVALVYNGRPFVVVMGTPADLEDLAVGFSLTEGIVDHEGAIERIGVVKASHGIELQIEIASADATRLEERSRGIVSRTGCGLCGVETINDAIRLPNRLDFTLDIAREALWRAGEQLARQQALNNETNSVHAAAWATTQGEIELIREDVGRHNALDKIIGWAALSGALPLADSVCIVSGRVSFEIVQKAATAGIPVIGAVSAPSSLAVQTAERVGVTVVGFLRGDRFNVYSHGDRVVV